MAIAKNDSTILTWDHKDRDPQTTVDHIQHLLHECGIDVCEMSNCENNRTFYSTKLTIKCLADGRPPLFVEGKGLSPDLAKASAYAEFMERLQNCSGVFSVFLPPGYGLMPERLAIPPDARRAEWRECQKTAQDVSRFLFPDPTKMPPDETPTWLLPYYCVSDDSLVELPAEFIVDRTGTNGMAAGNTPEEGILQGLCEIFERYVELSVFLGKRALPTIPRDQYQDLSCFHCVEVLEAHGLSVIVKDASLSGRYPVVAVLIVDPTHNRYAIKFGCDPVLDVAIQRCLTECFQGCHMDDFLSQRMTPVEWVDTQNNHISSLEDFPGTPLVIRIHNGSVKFGEHVLIAKNEPSAHTSAFFPLEDNATMLRKLIERNLAFHHQIYIRDQSFLGFPTYHIYIPGLSEIGAPPLFDADNSWLQDSHLKKTRYFLLRLPNHSAQDIQLWAKRSNCALEFLLQGEIPVKSWFGNIMTREETNLENLLQPFLLLAELYLAVHDYQEAFSALTAFARECSSIIEPESRPYLLCALAAVRLKAQGIDKREISDTLANLYGQELSQEVLSDTIYRETPFHNYKLPVCGLCSSCPIQEYCFYEEWKALVHRLNENMQKNPINQQNLSTVFGCQEKH